VSRLSQLKQVASLNPRLADSLNELAILYATQHKHAQAEPMFQRALGVSVAALGSDHPDVAIVLKNIGILKASQRQYAEADLLLSQSLSLTNRLGARASNRGGYDENDRHVSGHPGPLWGSRAVHSSLA
jgi:Tfp pilus assembly protein PilF